MNKHKEILRCNYYSGAIIKTTYLDATDLISDICNLNLTKLNGAGVK